MNKKTKGWFGYGASAATNALIGYIGYLLKDGITIKGTDTYTPNTPGAQPIVSHTSQFYQTSPIGYALMGIAIANFAYQAYNTYKINKIANGQNKIMEYQDSLESKLITGVGDVTEKISHGIKAIKEYISNNLNDLTESVESLNYANKSIVNEINKGIEEKSTEILNTVNDKSREVLNHTDYTKDSVAEVNGKLDKAIMKLSNSIPPQKRKEIVNKNMEGGNE